MDDITVIYKNNFGLVFYWKRCAAKNYKKLNLVFNNTALHLTEVEMLIFSGHIETALNKLIKINNTSDQEHLMHLETPTPQVSFIVNYEELICVQNLVEGALFELELITCLDYIHNQNKSS
ncbi:hypothetical protein [Algibacter pectinivorans]|uniref:Uncharacterized protein n=1 Tax=Algibacter pectinivorans TaxID=870482 RepID=A0A1I1R2T5_9FLAO|nr:hypothetical protein [Algibacter pectinivorans]SFD24570.1 hypothetical protein SAMN04487987_10775 [Algibacter pectinivorans]